jgi:hypothetical protein
MAAPAVPGKFDRCHLADPGAGLDGGVEPELEKRGAEQRLPGAPLQPVDRSHSRYVMTTAVYGDAPAVCTATLSGSAN